MKLKSSDSANKKSGRSDKLKRVNQYKETTNKKEIVCQWEC